MAGITENQVLQELLSTLRTEQLEGLSEEELASGLTSMEIAGAMNCTQATASRQLSKGVRAGIFVATRSYTISVIGSRVRTIRYKLAE